MTSLPSQTFPNHSQTDADCDTIDLQDIDACRQSTVTTHQIFPGITLIYYDVHTQSLNREKQSTVSDHVFEISHCREGRLEYNIGPSFCYLAPGDLAIAQTNRICSAAYFPLQHYHGITIRVDTDLAPKCLSCFLHDVTVQPAWIAEKFCTGRAGFVARSNRSFEHIFSELYSVPEKIKKGYFKIKILELFLFLSVLDIGQDEMSLRTHSESQAILAKEIGRYLTEHIDDRITLEQLSEKFHVSGTHIKNTFKIVYGSSVYAFIRAQKMESAACMLEYTNKSILEIAGAHGYDNGSKFASAFRDVKGMTPNAYRSMVRKREEP